MDEHENLKDKIKEGVSVREIESFAKKHTNEVFLILAIIIATFSSMLDFFTGPVWTIGFCGLGAIISIAFSEKIEGIEKVIFKFLTKQDKPIQFIIGIVQIILAVFVPFVIFAQIGLLAGIAFHNFPIHVLEEKKPQEPKKEEENI